MAGDPPFLIRLTRRAALAGLTPATATAAAAALGLAAFLALWRGHYWVGTALAFGFLLLATPDGWLARSAEARSRPAMVAARAINVIVPPLLCWAWNHGLAAFGRPLDPLSATMALAAILGGHVAQPVVEARFARRHAFPIHAWRPIDSRLRPFAAGPSATIALLAGSLLFARPDLGLELAAWWTIISLIFHSVRLAQAEELAGRGAPVRSWLEQ